MSQNRTVPTSAPIVEAPPTLEFYVKVTIDTVRLLTWARTYADVDMIAPEAAAGLLAHSLVPPFSMTSLAPNELRVQFVSMIASRAGRQP